MGVCMFMCICICFVLICLWFDLIGFVWFRFQLSNIIIYWLVIDFYGLLRV